MAEQHYRKVERGERERGRERRKWKVEGGKRVALPRRVGPGWVVPGCAALLN